MAETERVNSLKQPSWVAPKKWSALWRFFAGRQLLNALYLRKGVSLLFNYTNRILNTLFIRLKGLVLMSENQCLASYLTLSF